MKSVHCWDLDIKAIEIKQELANKIKERIYKKFKNLSQAAKYYTNTSYQSKSGKINLLSNICNGKVKKYKYKVKNLEIGIPILDLIKIGKDLGISKYEIEKNLVCLRYYKSHIKIFNPKFPIKISPIAACLLFHYYCDGSHENWSQSVEKHPINRKRYFHRIEKFIGKIKGWQSKRHEQIYTPLIIYKILEKLFDIRKEDFTKINLPKKLLNLRKDVLLGALVAIISDEGHICKDGHYEIRISQKNRDIITIIQEICRKLGYNIFKIKLEKGGIYNLKLTCLGLLKLHEDIKKLNENYSNLLDLGDKQQFLEKRVKNIKNKIKKENSKKTKGHGNKLVERDIQILEYFKNPITKRELSEVSKEPITTLHHRKGRLKTLD
jgi:hypothetical protein